MTQDPTPADRPPAQDPRHQAPEVPHGGLAFLEFEGTRQFLRPGRRLLIGSSPACGLRIKGPGIAPHHARVSLHPDGNLWFKPLEQATLRIGGRRVQKPIEVRPGEDVGLGLGIVRTGHQPSSLALQVRLSLEELHRARHSIGYRLGILLAACCLTGLMFVLFLMVMRDPDAGRDRAAAAVVSLDDGPTDTHEQFEPDEPEPTPEVEKDEIEDPMLATPELDSEEMDLSEGEPLQDTSGIRGPSLDDAFERDPFARIGNMGKGKEDHGRTLRGVGEGMLDKTSESLRRTVAELRDSGFEVAFLFDSTSSMSGVLREAKTRLEDMLFVFGSLVPDTRFGLLTYRDEGDAYVTREAPLGLGHYEAMAFLSSVVAAGGGDFPEAVHTALVKANRWKWGRNTSKVLILIGDAPPHPGNALSVARRQASAFRRVRKGQVHCLYTTQEKETIEAFRRIAKDGGGQCLPLEDHRDLLVSLLELSLKAQRKDVEQLIANLNVARARERNRAGTLRAPVQALAQTVTEEDPDAVIVESWADADSRELGQLGPQVEDRSLSREGLMALCYLVAQSLDRRMLAFQMPEPETLSLPKQGLPRELRPFLGAANR
ncbi:MAG: hypothetical protein R3F30_05600 [Planctomycetota bacterium]